MGRVLRPGDGGLIALSAADGVVLRTNTGHMSCGWRDSEGGGGTCLWSEDLPGGSP